MSSENERSFSQAKLVISSQPPKPRTWKESEIRSRRDLHKVLHGGCKGDKLGLARTVVDWLLGSGRLPEYRLASNRVVLFAIK
jgi:hypothetical protein